MTKIQNLSFAVLIIAVMLVVIGFSNGFSFDGSTVHCTVNNKTVEVKGYPKMKSQYEKCNKTIYEGYKKRGETPDEYTPLMCTALCVFQEDKLIDGKTGLLLKSGLDSYKDMFDHIPQEVRKEMKNAFYTCFEEHKNDTIFDAKKPNECSGVAGVGICIKNQIDAVCNPKSAQKEE